ncbi:hypothetical protein [Acinetobacter colistiniresistens]|uniref:hypothetical protein n=1 Tax=Acinetobacter colistiniresistens TaxID=280145 RepID=UPI002FE40EB0
MATDVDVQYFNSNNIGLQVTNKWGDLIRLLDVVLVNGLPVSYLTGVRITAENEIELLSTKYPAMLLLQVVELSGCTPLELNQKYRVTKIVGGTPYVTKLKPANNFPLALVGKDTVFGSGKISPLGYDIVYRDEGDVKRVYRAKNPRVEHPFIRVDETIVTTEGTNTGTYTSSYAKYAMVGLHSQMSHIDDTNDPTAYKLPNMAANYEISGKGATVIRGFARWYWARNSNATSSSADIDSITEGSRYFFLCGDKDSFTCHMALTPDTNEPQVFGAGILENDYVEHYAQKWFLAAIAYRTYANTSFNPYQYGSLAFAASAFQDGRVQMLTLLWNNLSSYSYLYPASPTVSTNVSGRNDCFSAAQPSAAGFLAVDYEKRIRGAFKHICFYGQNISTSSLASISYGDVYNNSMYIRSLQVRGQINTFYLGEFDR